jgi:hypothetical protein
MFWCSVQVMARFSPNLSLLAEGLNIVVSQPGVRDGLEISAVVGKTDDQKTGLVPIVGHGTNVLGEFGFGRLGLKGRRLEGMALNFEIDIGRFSALDQVEKIGVVHRGVLWRLPQEL